MNYRKNNIDMFTKILEDNLSIVPALDKVKGGLASIAVSMERGCKNAAVLEAIRDCIDRSFTNEKFRCRYDSIIYQVAVNLDPTSSVVGSDYLIKKIEQYYIDGSGYKPINIGSMTPQQLCPDKTSRELEEIKIRSQQSTTIKYSTMHKCGKCGESKTTHQSAQIRSLDEGTSTKYTCINCWNSWVVNA